jgi:hypothetical protein
MAESMGVTAKAAGLSPEVEPASGLDGSATSIPNAEAFARPNCRGCNGHGRVTEIPRDGGDAHPVLCGNCLAAASAILTEREKETLRGELPRLQKGPLRANLAKKGLAQKIANRTRYELTDLGRAVQAKVRRTAPPPKQMCPVEVARAIAEHRRRGGHIHALSFATGIPVRTLVDYANKSELIAPGHERVLSDVLGLPPPFEALEERRRIVAWLRENAVPGIAPTGYLAFRVLADAIERGDYEPEGVGG